MKESKKKKRHQPHTSGQCSFHSAYILALVWIFLKNKTKKTWLRYKKQCLTNNTDIRVFVYEGGGARRMKTACDCDVQRKRRPVRDQELRPR